MPSRFAIAALGLGIPVVAVFFVLAGARGQVSAPHAPRFIDRASASHFGYRTNNDLHERKYFPQPMCGGIAAFDYDGDGKIDIFLTNGAKLPELVKTGPSFFNALLRNKGDGTFEDVTEQAGLAGKSLGYSFGVAAGDFDNDGFEDLFVANAGKNTLYRNNGNGTFTDVTDISGIGLKPADSISVAAAWFDYDNDGLLDLIVANYTVWTPASDIRCQQGGRDYYCDPTHYQSVAQQLYHNLGGGKFRDVTEPAGFAHELGKGMGIAIADFNGDGAMDVFIANDTVRNFLFINRKDGTFAESGFTYGVAYDESGQSVSAMGADAKDYDNDGRPDIFYNDLKGQTWGLFHNIAGKAFQYVSGQSRIGRLSAEWSGWSAGFIDYNNDGWKDLYGANGDVDNLTASSPQHDVMFENIDGRHFVDVSNQLGSAFSEPGYQRGSAFADFNNDGFMDIVVTSLGAKPRILFNTADNGNHYLLVDTVGHKSNRDGVGAQLKLTTASGRVLYNHVTTSVGFMSSSDKRVHFGLGAETRIASLEIGWPSGVVQTLKQPPSDRILRIEEPPR